MKFKLPDSVASSQDLASLLIELRQYTHWFTHESIKKLVSARHRSDPPIVSAAGTEILRFCEADKTLTQQSLESMIETLEKYSGTAPSITITLAAPPTSSIKTTLVAWCRENIAHNILVTFQFNTTLLGGMVVRYGSHIFDWSFRRQILATRQSFPEVLRHV